MACIGTSCLDLQVSKYLANNSDFFWQLNAALFLLLLVFLTAGIGHMIPDFNSTSSAVGHPVSLEELRRKPLASRFLYSRLISL